LGAAPRSAHFVQCVFQQHLQWMLGILRSGQAGLVYRGRGTSNTGLFTSLLDPSQLRVSLRVEKKSLYTDLLTNFASAVSAPAATTPNETSWGYPLPARPSCAERLFRPIRLRIDFRSHLSAPSAVKDEPKILSSSIASNRPTCADGEQLAGHLGQPQPRSTADLAWSSVLTASEPLSH
jgi:hypothetical protein